MDEQGGTVVYPDTDKRQSMKDTVDDFIRRKLITRGERQRISANEEMSPVLNYLANAFGAEPEPV